jgi:methionyl-tRNA formyltransferase
LPQYRGAAPINRAIMNGEKETGVTTFFIDKKMDTGRLLFTEATSIAAGENAGQLHDRLMKMGAGLVVKTVAAIAGGDVRPTPQPAIPAAQLKDAPKITKETRRIDWQQTQETIHNQVRGLSPYPAAIAELRHGTGSPATLVKILATKTETTPHGFSPGTIRVEGKDALKVACGNGFIIISELQPAGKQAMTATQFLAGFRRPEEYRFQ